MHTQEYVSVYKNDNPRKRGHEPKRRGRHGRDPREGIWERMEGGKGGEWCNSILI